MARLARLGTMVALALLLAFSILGEVVVVPLALAEARSVYPELGWLITPAYLGIITVVLCGQAMIAITWWLTAMTADERIFSARALRLVGILTALPFAAFVLLLAAFVGLWVFHLAQPGVMLLLLGAMLVALAMGFVLVTMRALLLRAVAEHTELSEVV